MKIVVKFWRLVLSRATIKNGVQNGRVITITLSTSELTTIEWCLREAAARTSPHDILGRNVGSLIGDIDTFWGQILKKRYSK